MISEVIELSDASTEAEDQKDHKPCPDDFLMPTFGKGQGRLTNATKGNWHVTTNKARAGDLYALQALAACSESLPSEEIAGACEAFCFHLRKAAPYRDSEAEICIDEQRAMVAVRGLGDLLEDITGGDIENTVHLSWMALTRWLLYFYAKFIQQDRSNSELLAVSIAMLLGNASKLDGIRKQVCSNALILRLIFAMWSQEQQIFLEYGDYYYDIVKAVVHCASYSDGIRDKFARMTETKGFYVPMLVATNHLERIEYAKYLQQPWKALDYYSKLMLLFTSRSSEPPTSLQLNFNLNDGAYVLNDLLSDKLVETFPPPESIHYESACAAVTQLFTFLIRTWEQGSVGATIAPHQLPGGFLKALIDFSPSLGQEPLRSSFCGLVATTVSDTLPGYFMDYQLLHRFEKAFNTAYTQEARQRIMTSPVAKEWEFFEAFLLERLAYKHLFDANEDKEPRHLRCGNPDCEAIDKTNTFKLCAACKVERYCSKNCQLTAWKYNGHKQACAKTKERKADDVIKEEFVLYCIRRDIIRHLPGIRKLASRQIGNADFDEVGVGIDYTALPIGFEVYRFQSLMNQVFDYEDGLEKHLRRRLSDPVGKMRNDVFVRAILPDGREVTKKLHVEISLERVDAFAVSEAEKPPAEYISKRLVGRDSKNVPLDVVAFDRVDQFLIPHPQPKPMDVDTDSQ